MTTPITKKCSRATCTRTLSINSPERTCEECREANKESARKYRKRKREKENQEVASATSRPSQKAKIQGGTDASDGRDEDEIESIGDPFSDYVNADCFFSDLRDQTKNPGSLEIQARYCLDQDSDVSPKERVAMIAKEIWTVTGYRWTVRDHRPIGVGGHQTRFWCSQDANRKKDAKPSANDTAKRRDTVGMSRFQCRSRLTIRYRVTPQRILAEIQLYHHVRHVRYLDVSMPPEAKDMIQEKAEWATPSDLASLVRKAYPQVSKDQIYKTWREFTEVLWRRHECQLKSARILLEEFSDVVDVLEVTNLPDGVEALAWGMKQIVEPLRGRVVEIAMDATYNTNSRHLELYSIMAEHDNAGFPLTYCLLTTATAIELGKRKKALTAWARCVRDKYDIRPTFTHVDKDLGEIAALRTVWPDAKVSLCWWHLRRAVRTRLKKAQLATTAYDVSRAQSEFSFITTDFIPPGKKVDVDDYEGGIPDDAHLINDSDEAECEPEPPVLDEVVPSSLRIRLPPPSQPIPLTEDRSESVRAPESSQSMRPRIRGTGFTLLLRETDSADNEEDSTDVAADDTRTRRTFCPPDFRQTILDMMERHYCAHPDIPGYAAPTPAAIKRWAVQQIYTFCYNNDLPELWAYLWENWYRSGRWELWARSVNTLIPVLKTTMILESHWRRLKHDFLHHFKMPRCDLLAWVIVKKLAPMYYIKLDNILVTTGRYRELPSWRKGFKKIWRDLETRTTSLAQKFDTYRPDAQKWVCTCPSFVTSRFLVCKHLVQLVHRVPPKFFLEVKRQRSIPFWQHPTLRPKDVGDDDDGTGSDKEEMQEKGDISDDDLPEHDDDDEADVVEDDDEDDVNERVGMTNDGRTFTEALSADINLIKDFVAGIEFQMKFRDERFLRALEREGAGFFRLAAACLEKEKQANRRGTALTFDRATSSAMFYRARSDDK